MNAVFVCLSLRIHSSLAQFVDVAVTIIILNVERLQLTIVTFRLTMKNEG